MVTNNPSLQSYQMYGSKEEINQLKKQWDMAYKNNPGKQVSKKQA